MTVLAVTSIIIFAFFCDSGFRALGLDPKARLNRVVFCLYSVLAAWALDAAFSFVSPVPGFSRAWYLIFTPMWNLFFGLALHFCILASAPKKKLGWAAIVLLYAPGSVFATILDYLELTRPAGHGSFLGPPMPGELLGSLLSLHYFSWFLAGLLVLLFRRAKTKEPLERKRLLVLILAIAVPALGGFLTTFVVPRFGIVLPDVAVFWCSIWALGVRISMFRYGFIAPFRNIGDAVKLFSAFIAKSRDGIVLADAEGNIAVWSQAMAEITGVASSEVIGHSLLDTQRSFLVPTFQAPGSEGRIHRRLQDAMDGLPVNWTNSINEYPIKDRAGTTRWLQSAGFVINLGRKKTATAAIIRDVTAEKLAAAASLAERRRLEFAEKMEAVGTLAAGLSHDFNNILTGIKGTVSVLRLGEDEEGPAHRREVRGSLDLIDASASRGGELVRQLLAIARKSTSERRPVRLADAVNHALQLTRNSIDASVTVLSAVMPEDAVVMAEGAQVERVLINLIINAADSMTIMRPSGEAKGGKAVVAVLSGGAPEGKPMPGRRYWILSVKDEGVGIAKDELSRVFDPFYTTKLDGRSHGLGLPTVYAIAESHDGFAEVQSRPGLGSEFRVYFPVPPAEGAAP